ncbi:MAG: DUF3458 domain-containing protein [Arhodomonas sp.]|nr:DUF3458 domain-containing protein [Arhodomonas sp.]
MYHTLLGQGGFRRGLDLYFQRHDGQAVTCEDFLAAMANANHADLGQFARWYHQSGTPVVTVTDEFDPQTGRLTLTLSQHTPPTADQPEKQPLHIPVALGLLDTDGHDLPVRLSGEDERAAGTRVLELREAEQRFVVEGLSQRPVPSLLRGFSAPVRLEYDYSDESLAFLFSYDSDDFNRWEAGQRLASRILLRWVDGGPEDPPEYFLEAFRRTLTDPTADPALVAEALTLPAEGYLAEQMEVIDVAGIHHSREHLRAEIGRRLGAELRKAYDDNRVTGTYRPDPVDMGRRRLRNLALDYLFAAGDSDGLERCLTHYREADNMTDTMAALTLLADSPMPEAEAELEAFAERWHADPLVLDKWFRVQALSRREDAFERVRALADHPAFDARNPNRVRALIGAFCQGNTYHFHRSDGSGLHFPGGLGACTRWHQSPDRGATGQDAEPLAAL